MRAKLIKENIYDLFVPKSQKDIINSINKLSQKEKNEKMFFAALNGQFNIIKLLIENGADINAENNYGYTALDLAYINNISSNHEKIINLLKRYGVK